MSVVPERLVGAKGESKDLPLSFFVLSNSRLEADLEPLAEDARGGDTGDKDAGERDAGGRDTEGYFLSFLPFTLINFAEAEPRSELECLRDGESS